ncbi:MAG: ABC transporter permease [Gammaproteobacteria bacterium]|nr:ABC transporter permease [Gammaproteobacteria bacterium]
MEHSQTLREINWVAFKTIVYKEIKRFLRIWVQTITPPAVNAILYLLIFGTLIGSRVGEMGGHRYLDFIVPGIAMMAIIINSYSNVVSSFFSSKFMNHIEELLVSPVHPLTIVAGYIVGGVCRGLLVGTLVFSVAAIFVGFNMHSWVITVTMAVLTATMFASAGLINAVFAQTFDDTSIIPNFILTPLTYFGGIFYSIELLPEFWQNMSLANPVLYMINGFRYGVLGVSDMPISWSIGAVLLFNVAFMGLAYYLVSTGKGIKK